MAQDTKYNEEIKKLKSERNGHRSMAGIGGFGVIAYGGIIRLAYNLGLNPALYPPSTRNFWIIGTYMGAAGLVGLTFAALCYSEIAKSCKFSKKIRKLEKKLSEV